jgi:GNAT superfamily N-acetyltransferase
VATRHLVRHIMHVESKPGTIDEILPWRDLYREEMNCQIIHDSIHSRPGWTEVYRLWVKGTAVGYGLVAVSGPWKGKPTIFEMYILPDYRIYAFALFEALSAASGAVAIETQTNGPLLAIMLAAYCSNIECEKIIFCDGATTRLPSNGAVFRQAAPEDAQPIASENLDKDANWVLQHDGKIVATGGVLFHYNRPYGDIYMAVAAEFRRCGLGSYLVQELKRVCYAGGSIPAARCNPTNIASRQTLQRAGFVPCGNILIGQLTSS